MCFQWCIVQSIAAWTALFMTSAAVLADDWMPIADDSALSYELKASTLTVTRNASGEEIVTAITRVRRKSNNVSFAKDYVRISDCARQHGKLVSTGLDGDFLFETDFVLGGGTNASTAARKLCAAADMMKSAVQRER